MSICPPSIILPKSANSFVFFYTMLNFLDLENIIDMRLY